MRRLLPLLLAPVTVIALASPAAAHSGPGGEDASASNYRTRVLAMDPDVDGLRLRAVDAGSRLELVNDTGDEVIVIGYDGEPYLRIGADGVFENVRSPATYLNADRYADAPVPAEADPDAEPEWRRVSGGSTARWHDHRAHWMSPDPPPAVQDDRDSEHVIYEAWEVPLTVGGRDVVATGDLTWVPGPSPWPYFVVVAAVAALGVLVGRSGRWQLGVVALVVVAVGAAVVDTVGAWQATSDPALTKAGGLAAPLIGITVALGAVVMMRRTTREAMFMAVAAAAGLGLLVGVTNLSWLARSQLPTNLDPSFARGAITVALAAAAGALALTVVRLPALVSAPAPAARRGDPNRMFSLTPELQRHRWILIGAGAVVIALAVWVTAPSAEEAATPSDPVDVNQTHADLCAALAAAAAGDSATARSIFQDDVHGPLHEIAAAAQDVDRRVAARLLEAKQRAEADLAAAPTQFAGDLAALAPTVRDALAATGEPTPDACPQEDT